jgi:hypothetical protein
VVSSRSSSCSSGTRLAQLQLTKTKTRSATAHARIILADQGLSTLVVTWHSKMLPLCAIGHAR